MKRIIKVFMVAFMAVALCGCIKMNVEVEVKSDLSMDAKMDVLMEEEMITSSGQDVNETIEGMKKQLTSEDSMKDAKVSSIEKTIDGKKWVGVSVEGLSQKDEVNGVLKKETVDGKEKIVLTLPMDELSDEMDLDSMGGGLYTIDQMKKLGLEMTMTIKMPAEVTSNVGTVDGNQVTIDLLDLMANGQKNDIVISSDVSNGMDMTIVYVVLGLVIIAGGIFFVLKKKKKGNEEPLVEETVQKYCPNCGQEINENDEVCPHCQFDLKK